MRTVNASLAIRFAGSLTLNSREMKTDHIRDYVHLCLIGQAHNLHD